MNEEIIALFRKYINGQCDPGEVDHVLSMLQQGKYPTEWEFVLAEASERAMWSTTDSAAPDEVDAALYRRVKRSLADRQASALSLPNRKRQWPKFAAAAIVMLTLGLYLFQYTDLQWWQTEIADVSPGGNKAYLILSDGSKIALEDAINGQLAEESGIRIKKTDDGQIIYEILESDQPTSENQLPKYNSIETPRGGQFQIALSDGTKVWLNSDSRLTYPSRFSEKERLVEVQGEAYFEVSKIKDSPFKVSSDGQLIEVLGTHFNVSAYPDDEVTRTTLLEGAVQVTSTSDQLSNPQRNQSTILRPGQQSQLSGATIRVREEVDLEETVAWKNGYFKFSESLESIMTKVARWYDVKVEYADDFGEELQFYGKISRSNNLSAILEIIEATGNVRFRIENKATKEKNIPAGQAERRVIVMK